MNVKVGMRSITILPAVVILLAGCGSPTSSSASTTSLPSASSTSSTPSPTASSGRVSGTVLAGPSCPVESIDSATCEPKPVKGVVQLKRGDLVIAAGRTDANGAFTIVAPAGHYALTVDTGGSLYPRCQLLEVIVGAAAAVTADVMCDTGLR